jgi:sporulation protein YlmC with PRC-barrel domain
MRAFLLGSAVLVVLGLGIGAGIAQQQTLPQQGLTDGQASQQDYQHSETAHTSKAIVRASDVIGMDVTNNAKEDLGSIEDLAINPNTGKIEYAAVSLGGFLGLGDELFAVPWNAIECRPEEGTTSQAGEEADHVAVLNVDKESLKNAQGFNQDNWPNMADDNWRMENDRPYQSRRTSEQPVR